MEVEGKETCIRCRHVILLCPQFDEAICVCDQKPIKDVDWLFFGLQIEQEERGIMD